jgi:hypothetical protein
MLPLFDWAELFFPRVEFWLKDLSSVKIKITESATTELISTVHDRD